ncbi:MAG: histidine kinase [Hyphomicrobium sp.]
MAEAWSALDIVTKFSLVAVLAIMSGMGVFGWWVAQRIERGIIEHAAVNAALHLDSFVEPHLQDLYRGTVLPEEAKQALNALVSSSAKGHALTSVTIWNSNGRAVYSTDTSLDLAALETPAEVLRALGGSVENRFEHAGWVAGEAAQGGPQGGTPGAVLRLFAPMHYTPTLEPIGVAEVHERAGRLAEVVTSARFETAGLLALLSLAMAGSMFGIVRKAGRTIAEQKSALTSRVGDLSSLLVENTDLQRRILDANLRSTETNDRILKRISAELHDGPVQLVALALLRLEGVRNVQGDAQAPDRVDDDVEAIESALRDALKEIRGLSSGLSLPKLEGASVRQAIEYAVMNHECRSRTRVKLALGEGLPKSAAPLFLTSLYRFIQEGLNNAVRHAGGKDQAVTARFENGDFVLEVSDGGPGMAGAVKPVMSDTKGLGLIGLADRIEALGGQFEIDTSEGAGLCLRARFAKNALGQLGI